MAKAKKKNGNGSNASSFEAQVASVLTSVNALMTTVQGLGLPALTDEERAHTMGKLRVGEDAAMTCIFDTIDGYPAIFESLANRDGGSDPNVVETQPSRNALARSETLAPLAIAIDKLAQIVGDGIIGEANTAKELSVPAYAIGKALAATNAKLRTTFALALTFYGSKARKTVAVKKRAANAVTRAAKSAKKAGAATA